MTDFWIPVAVCIKADGPREAEAYWEDEVARTLDDQVAALQSGGANLEPLPLHPARKPDDCDALFCDYEPTEKVYLCSSHADEVRALLETDPDPDPDPDPSPPADRYKHLRLGSERYEARAIQELEAASDLLNPEPGGAMNSAIVTDKNQRNANEALARAQVFATLSVAHTIGELLGYLENGRIEVVN